MYSESSRTLKVMGLCMEDAVRVAAGPAGVRTMLSAAQATPETIEVTEILEAEDRPWVTVVWDDPVNLMHYVTYIFQKLFGYSKGKATELMLKVHNEGKAVVSSGSRDKMEHDVQRLHAAGLWATMQRDQ
ncbi:ATP-dependent Clp protease adaptor protein ClpS [Nocardia pseudobrasiliensis]|uniref:ATP-dependent Clp protease adapter protein ClpS n=2 Tax=Nocardia pseudobrasiliensis TaxID=45979 RepID=A0A370HXE8_9NOCA|nr:ATP-dependent Clp protease adaptor protein ClpS [Nocardia pseudobrasiliensis]